ncbi:MAG: hypothetical protein ACI8P3_000858, partial [Saprospiraceae bacterium]
MKMYKISTVLIAIFTLSLTSLSFAQFDDLYYNPDTDANYSTSNSDYEESDSDYDDDEYDYDVDNDNDRYDDSDDRYDYYYTSRIRRFHRPYYGFNYYDPVYVDRGYYDPYFSPGVNVYIYNSPYSYNNWRRYNRGNSYNNYYGNGYRSGWSFSVGNNYNNGYGYNNSNSGYGGYNNYGNGGGYSNYGYGGGGGGYNGYCGPSYSNPYNYTTTSSGSSDQDVYYGSRKRGAGNAPSTSPRSSRNESATDVTRTAAGDRATVRGTDGNAKDVTRTQRSGYDVYDAGSS